MLLLCSYMSWYTFVDEAPGLYTTPGPGMYLGRKNMFLVAIGGIKEDGSGRASETL